MSKWIVGTNMPGYMPDSEPSIADNFRQAADSLAEEMLNDASALYDDDGSEPQNLEALNELTNEAARLQTSHRGEYGRTINGRHYWLTKA